MLWNGYRPEIWWANLAKKTTSKVTPMLLAIWYRTQKRILHVATSSYRGFSVSHIKWNSFTVADVHTGYLMDRTNQSIKNQRQKEIERLFWNSSVTDEENPENNSAWNNQSPIDNKALHVVSSQLRHQLRGSKKVRQIIGRITTILG